MHVLFGALVGALVIPVIAAFRRALLWVGYPRWWSTFWLWDWAPLVAFGVTFTVAGALMALII